MCDVGACFWAAGNRRQPCLKCMESGAVALWTCVSVAESVWSKCVASDRAFSCQSSFTCQESLASLLSFAVSNSAEVGTGDAYPSTFRISC